MNRKQSQNRTTTLSNRLELFYLQAVLPEQNDRGEAVWHEGVAIALGVFL
jgi:hypothetical protein